MITVFLRSLTQSWDGQLIAVIVSGYDGDGAAALCGIKKVGGITIAQKLATAIQPDRPESAIASGCIDYVLSPEGIAKEIVRIAQAVESAEPVKRTVLDNALGENALCQMERLARHLSCQPDMRVLDLGCGRATNFFAFTSMGNARRKTSIRS